MSGGPSSGPSVGAGDVPRFTVHWRPGCGFCSRLLRGLERTGIAFDRVDIWEHPEAAAWVRSVAGGNETVPTVRIGDRGLVNPSVDEVLAALADAEPPAE
jgi:mycoredoxin